MRDLLKYKVNIDGEDVLLHKNGIFILVRKNTSFESLILKDKDVEYDVRERRYSDLELYNNIITDSLNRSRINWAIILFVNNEDIVELYSVKKVKVYDRRMILSCCDVCQEGNQVGEFIEKLSIELNLNRLIHEYMLQNNYLIDIKKYITPYKETTIQKTKKSLLSNNVDKYIQAERNFFFYRPRAINEYAKVIEETGHNNFPSIKSLNSVFAIIKDDCTDIVNNAYNGFSGCIDSYLEEFESNLGNVSSEFRVALLNNDFLKKFIYLFLEKNFYNEINARIKIKPDTNLYEIHMGKNWINGRRKIRTLYISPRFRNGIWENDVSKIRREEFEYYTIGHLLKSGLVIDEGDNVALKKYNSFLEALPDIYISDELENDEKRFVECYVKYINENHERLEKIPLLIPQFRFCGKEEKHKYRGDFLILNYTNRNNIRKVLIELSRNNLHDRLSEEDALRRNDFIEKYNCLTIELRDSEIADMENAFHRRIVSPGYLS